MKAGGLIQILIWRIWFTKTGKACANKIVPGQTAWKRDYLFVCLSEKLL